MCTHNRHLSSFSQRNFTNMDLRLLPERQEMGRVGHIPVIPALGRLLHIKCEASRSYIARPYLKRGAGEPRRD